MVYIDVKYGFIVYLLLDWFLTGLSHQFFLKRETEPAMESASLFHYEPLNHLTLINSQTDGLKINYCSILTAEGSIIISNVEPRGTSKVPTISTNFLAFKVTFARAFIVTSFKLKPKPAEIVFEFCPPLK